MAKSITSRSRRQRNTQWLTALGQSSSTSTFWMRRTSTNSSIENTAIHTFKKSPRPKMESRSPAPTFQQSRRPPLRMTLSCSYLAVTKDYRESVVRNLFRKDCSGASTLRLVGALRWLVSYVEPQAQRPEKRDILFTGASTGSATGGSVA